MPTPRSTTTRDRLRRQVSRGHPPCHLCGDPIDYSLRSPDPLSFEVDHVIPRSRGGEDTLDNAAPSHRRCNRAKSNRLATDDAVIYVTERSW